MEHSVKIGLSFGLTSGVITTLGLMVGLSAGTHSKLVVIGGILTIAIADAFSDALGIHVSEESEGKHTGKEIWTSTISTWLAKFLVALSFLVPILLFELSTAVMAAVLWGLVLLAVYSYHIASNGKVSPYHVIFEHLAIAVVVIIITNFVGGWISEVFV